MGMPPDTIKDVLMLGIGVPTHYIVPTERFNKEFGVVVAEFEFPAYFNFFVLRKKINLICTSEAQDAIRVVFRETLLGPMDFSVSFPSLPACIIALENRRGVLPYLQQGRDPLIRKRAEDLCGQSFQPEGTSSCRYTSQFHRLRRGNQYPISELTF